MLGRFIGVAFVVPLTFFGVRRMLTAPFAARMTGIAALIGTQVRPLVLLLSPCLLCLLVMPGMPGMPVDYPGDVGVLWWGVRNCGDIPLP